MPQAQVLFVFAYVSLGARQDFQEEEGEEVGEK